MAYQLRKYYYDNDIRVTMAMCMVHKIHDVFTKDVEREISKKHIT